MKIALFSDIHANLPALNAFFKDISFRKPDAMYCLGDLVGYNIWPNEVVNAINSRQIPTLSGNHDTAVGLPAKSESGLYTNNVIGTEETKYLQSLPAHIRLDFQLKEEKISILLVHGSPRRNNEYLTEETDESLLLEMLDESEADILCFGHTHKHFHKIIPTEKGFKHAINLGSLGKPKDGDPRGCYAQLTIHANSTLKNKEAIDVEFCRVAYDVEKAAKAVEDCPSLPNKFAEALRLAQ
ncbi:metallophosphoesterase family protein [Flavicella sediminum]|uniref:metallophosphoesterase family protein n=1 Tax=Flavicella sediminum TaxID=2585141 RepID=UPI00111FAE40|nr:metallophosphoesterase family protein [Flavicella sediminum]